MPTKNAFISHKWTFFYMCILCLLCLLSTLSSVWNQPSGKEVVPWLLRMESKASLSQFVKLRKARNWRCLDEDILISCCLFDFVCWLCNKMFRFSSLLVGLEKILKSLFRLRRVSTWALSVFFVQNSCWGSCRIKDLTMHDICYQILQGREASCEKRGDFERWEVQELVGKWTTRLSAKTR